MLEILRAVLFNTREFKLRLKNHPEDVYHI